MVAAANPLAVDAGVKMLERGGSAVDAMIATQLVLNLVEPSSSGLGGGAFFLYYDAMAKAVRAIDARETAPAGAPPGGRALEGLSRQAPAAHPHAAEPHPGADPVLAAPLMGALDGKVGIVTGGAQGIGAAIARGLEAEGATVVVADLEPPEGGILADVSSEDDVARLVDETLARHGRIDVLVNNAGLYASLAMRPFTEIPLEEWRQVMDVNVASMFVTSRAVVPAMREEGGGKIVNISSGTPFRGVPFLLHYVTSKGAIVAFTRALAKELGKDSIHVNCVAPGFTMSDGVKAHPEVVDQLRDVSVAARTIQRDQVPEDVVGAVVFLCTPAADFVTGQTMVIDGGQYFH
jgi:NAD(P)-dependent dehydrogenase (short-subunit alcohol dehydrogenase family)